MRHKQIDEGALREVISDGLTPKQAVSRFGGRWTRAALVAAAWRLGLKFSKEARKQKLIVPITAAGMATLFSYNPETGHVTRRDGPQSGKRVGSVAKRGCREVSVNGRRMKEHHVIWLMMTGRLPSATIDHRDLDPANNKWDNLREATKAQQCGNHPLKQTNNSGCRGVHWSKHAGKWRAQIRTAGRVRSLGYFGSVAEAAAAYAAVAFSHYGEFYRPARSEKVGAAV